MTPRLGCGRSAATSAGRDEVARVLLDSTVLIDALRRRPAANRVRQMRRVGDEPWGCAVSVEERSIGGAFGHPPAVSWPAPLGVAEGERAGRWRRDLAASGVTVHQADCLIAAAALGIGGRLATGTRTTSDV